jgi:Fe2+ or Zn2+ uptake regulation protein
MHMPANLVVEASRHLQDHGGRMTSQRRLILETLETMDTHPTAEELFESARQFDSTLSLSTVYRTLRWLEEEELVSARIFDEDRRQERFDPVFANEHYHFMCTACKTVVEFDNLLVNTIKAQFELHSGAQVDVGSVVLYGRCANCRRNQIDASSLLTTGFDRNQPISQQRLSIP